MTDLPRERPATAPCPSCGEAVATTVSGPASGDQLAAGAVSCPACGASLVRAVDGHADHGWRLAEASA